MIAEPSVNMFDEETLKNVISCAVLMSSIDGEIHADEWEIIQGFADKHWKPDYKSFTKHQKLITNDINSILNKEEKVQLKLNELVEKLTGNLNAEQKNVVLNLIGDVMVADGIMTLEESKLFATFMDKIGIRIV